MKTIQKLLGLLLFFACLGCTSDDSNPQPETLYWEKVCVGGSHGLAIRSDGTLWAWGANAYGQLGDGTTLNRLSPVQIGSDNDWATIGAGQWHSVALKENGHLYTWGVNEFGNIGNGTYDNQLTPLQIGNDPWLKVSAIHGTTLALKSNGTIWSWGNNEAGQVGDGSGNGYVIVPTQIGTSSDWVDITMGAFHALGKKANGNLFAWGQYCSSNNSDTPQLITSGATVDWAKISAGTHTLGIKSDGKLFVTGYNSFGNLGTGPVNEWICEFEQVTGSTWTMIDAGPVNSAGIKTDGSLWVWGYNTRGQLGLGDGEHRYFPTQLGTDVNWKFVELGGWFGVALTTDNTLWTWGNIPTMENGYANGPTPPFVIPCPQ